jgi:hypothetical protein
MAPTPRSCPNPSKQPAKAGAAASEPGALQNLPPRALPPSTPPAQADGLTTTAAPAKQRQPQPTSRRPWRRRLSDASVGALVVAILAFALQLVDSAAVNRYWQRFKGVVTNQAPPPDIQGLPYALNTAGLPRKPVQIYTGGHVDQPFVAAAKRVDRLKVIIGRDDADQGYADDAPIGRVRLQLWDENRLLVDKEVIAKNNTATEGSVDVPVQPGRTYNFRVVNVEPDARLGVYFTEEERAPSATIQERPDAASYPYPHQLASTVRCRD